MLKQEIMNMTLEIARFGNLLLVRLPAGSEFGSRAALPAPPLRKEKEAYGATVSSMQEKRGANL
jgi:hypothetical protein